MRQDPDMANLQNPSRAQRTPVTGRPPGQAPTVPAPFDARFGQDLCDLLHAELALVCNFMDREGRIVASSDRTRLGQTHAIAQRIMHGEMDEYGVTPEEAARSGIMREGVLMAIDIDGQRLACFTIAGPLAQVQPLARIVRFCVTALLQTTARNQVAAEALAPDPAAAPATNLSELLQRASETVEFSLARLHNAIDHIKQGITLFDPQLRLVMCNRPFLELVDWPVGVPCVGLTFEALLARYASDHGLDRGQLGPALARRIAHLRAGRNNDFEFTTARGVVLLISDRPLPDGSVVSTLTDITGRKRMEDHLRQAATFFDNSADGVAITQTDGTIVTVNPAFTAITGHTRADVVGKNLRMLQSSRQGARPYRQMWQSLASNGHWQGEIWNQRKSGEMYPEWLSIMAVRDAHGQATHYVATFSDITQKKHNEERIQQLAFTDPLTRLSNRRLLLDRLEHALMVSARTHGRGAVFFIDIDNFKGLNETRGHHVGDQLLQHAAQRLTRCASEGDTVARFGGDEFVVLAEGLAQNALHAMAQAEALGDAMLQELDAPYALEGEQHHHSASIGVALFGDAGTTVTELLKQADMAMYRAKASGRNTLCFFDPGMQSALNERTALEKALREALERHEFALHYQPQVDESGATIGVEALLRWVRRDGRVVAPGEFIALAEETGLILPIGRWVLETACRQLVAWAREPAFEHLSIAVNVSARQFHHAEFAEQVLDVLEATGANPHRLKLELTESLLIDNVESVITKMQTLKAHGVGFSLDDFGTGYSSLGYLKRLPLDQLKIDQSFVRGVLTDANDAAIARMVVALADSLGLEVIAEGVEQGEQRDFLRHHGCHAYQGYLFSPAIEVEALHA